MPTLPTEILDDMEIDDSIIAKAASILSQHPDVWVKVGAFLYKRLTERASFSRKDMKLYKKMTTFY